MDHSNTPEERRQTARALADVAAGVIRAVTDRHGMSMTAASTLARLERDGPARLTALATAEGVAQPSMTQLVQRLERQELAQRIADPADGRVSLVAITDTGRDHLAERRRTREAHLAGLLAALPDEEQQALAAAMRTALPLVRRMLQEETEPHLFPERPTTGSTH
ncbi:MarR family winged helix-turn-helix transcriptional regulator [Streptomyces sp. MS06]|uniref:MarR family winged helix-turn-helix transcriptional regulator n=1 Tax=Streptomyces sp. MS06 TaxID=3385974 RepID=UPI0039A02DB9